MVVLERKRGARHAGFRAFSRRWILSRKKRVIVLGAGMVGSVIAMDLAGESDLKVAAADVSRASLERFPAGGRVETIHADLSDPAEIARLAGDYDLAVGALPGRLGFAALKAVIEAGRDYCDISFMPENALDLDAQAREAGVTAFVDFGVAPGMSNLLVGRACAELDSVELVAVYVGGLPRVRTLPWQYKAPFSPSDVIEEYVRPARMIEAGEVVVKKALSDPEMIDFPGVGTLEAFNTDGLRSLLFTVKAKRMIEKTMRWPGHRELVEALRDAGFFREDEIDVGSQRIRPLDVTSALLFPKWKYGRDEEDITVMRIAVEGTRNGRKTGFEWNLTDCFDQATSYSSMARTTAFPAAVAARMILDGRLMRPGVIPPEEIGRDSRLTAAVLSELRRRGVAFRESGPEDIM